MAPWKPGLVNSKSYLPLLDIKDPQWGALCLRPFDDKCFWNIDLNVKLRSSHKGFCVFFFLFPSLIFFLKPKLLFLRAERRIGGGRGGHTGEHLRGCVYVILERGHHICICICANVEVSLLFLCFPPHPPLFSSARLTEVRLIFETR